MKWWLVLWQVSLWGQLRPDLKSHPCLASSFHLSAPSLHYSFPGSTPQSVTRMWTQVLCSASRTWPKSVNISQINVEFPPTGFLRLERVTQGNTGHAEGSAYSWRGHSQYERYKETLFLNIGTYIGCKGWRSWLAVCLCMASSNP